MTSDFIGVLLANTVLPVERLMIRRVMLHYCINSA